MARSHRARPPKPRQSVFLYRANAKRAHLTAAHLVDGVLPQVPYRQWTFSFPWAVRFALARDVK
ncbi:MAG: hypothetical protein ACKVPX_10675, partial [Myxococcaceae bacterium]